MPLVNAFVEPGSPDAPRFPLDLTRCPVCTLVQIAETVPPSTLFSDYAYFSSYSTTFLEHARVFAAARIDDLGLSEESFVVEAASNDGYLLQHFVAAGIPALGIEPAANVAEVARSRGVDTIASFLDSRLARSIVDSRGVADLVVANNVFAHVPEIRDFLGALAILAGDRGLISIEVPYLVDFVDRLEFDTIYHEHVFYYSLTAVKRLADDRGLVVRDVERLTVHGGSLRIALSASGKPTAPVAELLRAESEWGVAEAATYDTFATRVDRLRATIHEYVTALAREGRVAAYGAAAKGVVLTNACSLDSSVLEFAVDRNPAKQGRLFPGVGIPVREPAALEQEQPAYCLLLAWNLVDEILSQQERYRSRGGRFVVPLPEPVVLNR
jgi:hypothetical protein